MKSLVLGHGELDTFLERGHKRTPPPFPLSTRSFGLIFLPKVINAEDTSSFFLMTLWKTSSYKEHNRLSKAQQTHTEVKGSYENLRKTRCPSPAWPPWPGLRVPSPPFFFPSLSSYLCVKYNSFKRSWIWTVVGTLRIQSWKDDCLTWKNSTSCFRGMRKYTANNIQMSTHRHFLRWATLRCGSWNCVRHPQGIMK